MDLAVSDPRLSVRGGELHTPPTLSEAISGLPEENDI